MKTVGPIVLRQPIFDAVDRDAPPGQAVGIAANHGTEVRQMIFRKIVRHIIKSLHHVASIAVAVRHNKRDDSGAEIGDFHLDSGIVAKRKKADGLAVIFQVIHILLTRAAPLYCGSAKEKKLTKWQFFAFEKKFQKHQKRPKIALS